ncbi:MAG: MFS transporter [Spirochaetaceae bacterium]|nr:MFS transporter [Spirochaetaceae bacterium]
MKTIEQKGFQRFLLVWSGQLLSSLGTGMTAFAVGVHVFLETGKVSGFASVVLALFLPSILLRPLGGLLADRFDRRVLIVFGDLGAAAGVLFLLLTLIFGELNMGKILLGVGVGSAFSALQNPAYKASLTDLLNAAQFARAAGLVQLAASAQHLLSPICAGVLLATSGLKTVLIIDAATFLFAVTTVLFIRGKLRPGQQDQKPPLMKQMTDGWYAVTKDTEIMDVVLILTAVTFFVGILQTVFPPMVLSFGDSRTLGLIQSVSAVGMVVGSLAVGIKGLSRETGRLLRLALAASGVFLLLMGSTTNSVYLTISFFLFFLCLPLINTSAEVLIRKGVPNELQGRAWGIIGLLSQIGYLAAYSAAGVLADRVFNPMLERGGTLALSVGRIIGSGPGRGTGLMLILSGFGIALTAAVGGRGVRRAVQS